MYAAAQEMRAPVDVFLAKLPLGAVALPDLGVGFAAFGAVLEDDIDHARNGVGAILRRRPGAEIFDMIDRTRRDKVEIDRCRSTAYGRQIVDRGGIMPALAVDQHQDIVAREPLHGVGPHAGRGAAAVLRGKGQGRNDRGQDILETGLAVRRDLRTGNDVDRHGA